MLQSFFLCYGDTNVAAAHGSRVVLTLIVSSAAVDSPIVMLMYVWPNNVRCDRATHRRVLVFAER